MALVDVCDTLAGAAVGAKRIHTSAVKGRWRFLHWLSRKGVQLCLVQSLRDVRGQIGRVFDTDRQPDRGVENAYFLANRDNARPMSSPNAAPGRNSGKNCARSRAALPVKICLENVWNAHGFRCLPRERRDLR